MKRKLVIGGIAAVAAAALLGTGGYFGYRYYLKHQDEQKLKSAQAEAVSYIESRYGFTPEVNTDDSTYNPIGEKNYEAVVSLRHDRAFVVHIWDDGEHLVWDNYQEPLIRQAVQDAVEQALPGSKLLQFYWIDRRNADGESTVFDGTNLHQVLSGKREITLTVGCVGDEPLTYDKLSFLQDLPLNGKAVFFDTEEHLQQVVERSNQLWGYAPTMTHVYGIAASEIWEEQFDLQDHGAFFTMLAPDEEQSGGTFTCTEESGASALSVYAAEQIDFEPPEVVSKEYCLKGSADHFWLYFPVSALPEDPEDPRYRQMICYYTAPNGELVSEWQGAFVYGDYAVCEFHNAADLHFVFVKKNYD